MLASIPFPTALSLARLCAIGAVITAGACTTAMNWRFAYQLGTTEWDSIVWATFSVALDVAKWLMLPFAALAWRPHKLRAVAAILIWLIATIYSFAAAMGFAALNRDSVAAERQSQVQLQGTLEIMRQSPRWQASAACADATAKLSKEFCAAYRATEARITATVSDSNPQTTLISRLTGTSAEAVELVLAVFLAIACEVMSALGLFAILPTAQDQGAAKTTARWKARGWQVAGSASVATGAVRRAEASPSWLLPVVAGHSRKRKAPGS